MRLAWALAVRDLRASKAGLRLLAICLFLGVATLAGIGSLTASILGEISNRGQAILGGDIQMQVAQRRATPQELSVFARAGRVSETVRMRAMAARADGTNAVLSELKGVDSAYPLYGAFRLAPGALMPRPARDGVAIAPALAEKLSVKVGDSIRMGEARLKVIGLIADEPDRVGEGFTLGPVVIADMAGLEATKLLQPGSLFNTRYRIKTAAQVDPKAAGKALSAAFPGAGWEVQDRSGGAPGTRRFIERLGQFLGLVGLTSLIIAGIGVGNGVASWLDSKRGSIATLKVLGAASATIFQIYLLQIIAVALFAIVLGVGVGALAPWLVAQVAGDALPVTPRFALYSVPLSIAAVQGLLIGLLFSLRPLSRARAVTAASLFRSGVEMDERPSKPMLIAMVGIAGMIAALAVASASEPLFAGVFIACVAGLLAVFTGLGVLIVKGAARLPRPRMPLLRLAIANLHRPGAQTGRLVVALGLGLTLFATLAFVQTSFDAQIASAIPARAPSFFALDIPKADEPRFRRAVASAAPDATLQSVPTLRGPVVALGTRRVADMKDLPREAWFLRGDRGLTFSKELPGGSTVTEGKWWDANYSGPPLVSIDERAARAVGLKLGDMITVSVLGAEIEAKITSLREINWDTMGFNFVLVFSPGSLDAAPYTLAATIAAETGQEAGINRAVTQAFPSVSIIRIKDVITQVSALLTQMAKAIALAASVAVLAGIAVLVGAIAASRRSRVYDAVLLKLLGGTRLQVLSAQAIEYSILALILSILSLGIGGLAGWYVVTQVFELEWTPNWMTALATVAAGGLGTLALGLIGSLPALSARPAQALRDL
jgi:putative ABC transport system permease protein